MAKQEKGQALIIMVFGVIALAAVVGLAIDSGRLYSQKRQTQNAADAASMAGALQLSNVIMSCSPGNAADDAAVRTAVIDLARQNGVDYTSANAAIQAAYVDGSLQHLGWVGAGSIPNGATAVSVTMVTSDTTTFLKIVGQERIRAAAASTGMVGVVKDLPPTPGGILPIAVPLEVVQALSPGQTFYVMENNQHHGGMYCLDGDGSNCIGDPANHNAHRGWLNFNFIYNTAHLSASDLNNRSFETNVANRGCGNDPTKSVDDGLQGWAGDDKNGDGMPDCPYPFTVYSGSVGGIDGDFIHGDPGARQSSLMDVINTYNNKIVVVPIFDFIYMSDYMADHFTPPEEPPDGNLGGNVWPRAGGGGHAFLYHIVGFAAVRINDNNLHDHILVGDFQRYTLGQYSDLVPTAGVGNTCDLTLKAISLWQ